MTKTKAKTVQPGETFVVPLNKLKKSPKNVRKTPHGDHAVAALAASIVAHGLLQNLVVEPELKDGRTTGHYLVNVGEGRRLALLSLAKRKAVRKDEPVRCLLGEAETAEQTSLAENIIRESMHPLDEYEAFRTLHEEKGLAADDIAARFGVSIAVVRQRLKLAAVSPVLLQVYRADGMSLQQLMAFTITDDHARQEQVWNDCGYDDSAYAIRRTLTEGQVAMSDRRAIFVGPEAYVEAGGVITKDLFDEDNGGYFPDVALLDRLVKAKLESEAQAVRAEGWGWVITTPEFDHRATSDMRRVYPSPAPLTGEAAQEVDALETEQEELTNAVDDGAEDEAIEQRLGDIEARLAELQGQPQFGAMDIARGGAFVSLGHNGEVRVERGFIRKADEPVARMNGEGAANAAPEKSQKLSDKLVAELTAYKTAALRNKVAGKPEVALLAVTHALAAQTFYHGERASCLELSARSEMLSRYIPGFDESPLGRASDERQTALAALLPEAVEDLWDVLAAMPQDELLRVLAHCAALAINVVMHTTAKLSLSVKQAEKLAEAVSLDMRQHWQPTAANYFGRVTKPLILDAVREDASAQAADNIASLKKEEMAAAAEALVNTWLPRVLRVGA
jgi:ParB family chromosome partitioning protein